MKTIILKTEEEQNYLLGAIHDNQNNLYHEIKHIEIRLQECIEKNYPTRFWTTRKNTYQKQIDIGEEILTSLK